MDLVFGDDDIFHAFSLFLSPVLPLLKRKTSHRFLLL